MRRQRRASAEDIPVSFLRLVVVTLLAAWGGGGGGGGCQVVVLAAQYNTSAAASWIELEVDDTFSGRNGNDYLVPTVRVRCICTVCLCTVCDLSIL